MKTRAFLGMAVIATLCVVGLNADDKEKDPLKGLKCPISGKKVVADKTKDYKDGQVYFCCPGCPGQFDASNEEHAAKGNYQLAATGQYKLEKCVLTGGKLNPATKIAVGYAEVAICFCCNNCKGKAEKAEDQVSFLFANKTFDKGYKLAKKEK